ncbi:MAG TPA: SpoIIE family protein phosphatase [Solirubrobacteraceae bacterium]|nr:SpoIIE family protein phosphatase [Solirubrobacteraceae bacterium]
MSLDAAGRLERLMAAGELADGITEAPEVVPRLLDLVVPSVAGACLLHQFREGALECTGARGIAPVPHPPARPDAEPVLTEDGAVVVPLRVRGRTTGWLTYAHDGFGDGDLRYLQVLSNRLAVALDNARLVLAERQLEALVAGMEEAVTVRDGDGRILLGNDAAVRLLGASSQEELRRTSLTDLWRRFALYRPDGTPMSDGDLSWMRALQDERPPPMLMRRVDRGTGEEQWLLSKATVLHGGDGRPELVMNVTEDVTATTRSELGRRLLVDAGRLLSEADDFEAALEDVARLVVPDLADWCAIELPGPGGYVHLAAVAHTDEQKVRLARELRSALPMHLDDDGLTTGVLRSGEPVRVVVDEAMLRAAVDDDEQLELLRALGLSAVLTAPLRSGDEVLGALTLVSAQEHRRFDEHDEELAVALARRVADALRNARLLRDRADIAHVLSTGLRPDPSPRLPGCEVAAVYKPAGEESEAGGDFYEVIDAPAGAIVVMGDVVGKGAPAAALSAVARVTLRTAGRLTGDPRAALDELNHTLRRRGGMSLCTACAVSLPSELPGDALVLLAGHPPPLLVRDGKVRPVGQHGPMLGAIEVADWPGERIELAPNDVLVLYTDGVLDAALPGGEHFGEERLHALVERAGADVEGIAGAIGEILPTLRLRDDIALLAIRCPGPPALLVRGTLDPAGEALAELTIPGGIAAPGTARRALSDALTGRASEPLLADVLIVVSELVTNAIRHGGAKEPDEEVRLDAAFLDGVLRIEVTDPGPGFEPGGHGPRADGGYGLHLLERLSARWGVAGSSPVTVWVELAR